MTIPKPEWVWYGYPGHYVCAHQCVYHLTTRIGPVLISTLGDQRRPESKAKVPIRAGDDIFFETLVFPCAGEDKAGDPIGTIDSAIYSRCYNTSIVAELGHRSICASYAERTPDVKIDMQGDWRIKDGDTVLWAGDEDNMKMLWKVIEHGDMTVNPSEGLELVQVHGRREEEE